MKRVKDFWSYYQKGFKTVWQEMGKPDLIHCHVMTRHALMAAWFQLRYGIPYVITEHWSRYYRRDFHNSKSVIRLWGDCPLVSCSMLLA